LREVVVRAGLKVLMEVDDNSVLIFDITQGDFRPPAQASLNPHIKDYYNNLNYLLNHIF
jgi:hypothetical protein